MPSAPTKLPLRPKARTLKLLLQNNVLSECFRERDRRSNVKAMQTISANVKYYVM